MSPRTVKAFQLALHAVHAAASRRRLRAACAGSSVARAIVAVLDDEFSADGRRTFEAIQAEKRRLAARRDATRSSGRSRSPWIRRGLLRRSGSPWVRW